MSNKSSHELTMSSSNSSLSSEPGECFICYESCNSFNESPVEMNDVNLIIRTCECKGKIHYRCFFSWLQNNMSCPVCRKPLHLSPTLENINQNLGPNRLSHVVILPNYGSTDADINLNRNMVEGIDINNNVVYNDANNQVRVIPFYRPIIRNPTLPCYTLVCFICAIGLFILILTQLGN
jgi:hypothetical protein